MFQGLKCLSCSKSDKGPTQWNPLEVSMWPLSYASYAHLKPVNTETRDGFAEICNKNNKLDAVWMQMCVSHEEAAKQILKYWPVLITNTIPEALLPGHYSWMPSWGIWCWCDSHKAFPLIKAQHKWSINEKYCIPIPGRWQTVAVPHMCPFFSC